jgi:hypothetical protein
MIPSRSLDVILRGLTFVHSPGSLERAADGPVFQTFSTSCAL